MHIPDIHGAEPRRIEALFSLGGARVLDVGCGEGRLTGFAATRAARVYAFDPNAERLEQARAAADAERVRFGVHGAEAPDVDRESFDVALCGWSLCCVEPEGVVAALTRIHAALVPGGRVVDAGPVSLRLPVTLGGERVGELEDDEWLEIVAAVDDEVEKMVASGLFELSYEKRHAVVHEFGSGDECLDVVGSLAGTTVPDGVAARPEHASACATVEHDVRLRLFFGR